MIRFEQSFVAEQQLPLVLTITQGRDAELAHVLAWFGEQNALLRRAQDRHGAVLVRGFKAIDSARAFSDVLSTIAPELMDYVGGSAPRSAIHGRVFNATALPGHFTLPLHQEMAYQEYRPDSLVLYCHQVASEGGETTLADARVVTERIDKNVRERCAPFLRVQRALPGVRVENRTRPWMDVFGTEDRSEVENIAAQKGWAVEWRPDNCLQLLQDTATFRSHPRTREQVWANQLHYHTPEGMLRWALRDGRADDAAYYRQLASDSPDKLDRVRYHDGQLVSSADAEHIWEALLQSEVPLRWQRGDVLMLDNVLAMHGRRAYCGERSVMVGMIREKSQPPDAVAGAPGRA